jgi:hypothetical protein
MIWHRNKPLAEDDVADLTALERIAGEARPVPPGLVERYMRAVTRARNAPARVGRASVVVWAAVLFIAATMVFRDLVSANFVVLITVASLLYGVTVRSVMERSIAPDVTSSDPDPLGADG